MTWKKQPRHRRERCEGTLATLPEDQRASWQKWCEANRDSVEKPKTLPPPNPPKTSPGLGDAVSAALALVGVTEERVSSWIGQPCGCSARKKRLNDLGAWAARVLLGDRSQPPLD